MPRDHLSILSPPKLPFLSFFLSSSMYPRVFFFSLFLIIIFNSLFFFFLCHKTIGNFVGKLKLDIWIKLLSFLKKKINGRERVKLLNCPKKKRVTHQLTLSLVWEILLQDWPALLFIYKCESVNIGKRHFSFLI